MDMDRQILLPLFLFSALAGLAYGAQLNHTSYTEPEANVIVANAANYVNAVNDSGYLIFYPNLTQAYSYLNTSYNLLKASPSGAVFYATLARSSAEAQYNAISYYRNVSLVVMVAITAIIAGFLYLFMRPMNIKKR